MVVFAWRVVGGEGCEGAVGDGEPEAFEVGGVVAQGRTADVFGAVEVIVGFGFDFGGEEEEV